MFFGIANFFEELVNLKVSSAILIGSLKYEQHDKVFGLVVLMDSVLS